MSEFSKIYSSQILQLGALAAAIAASAYFLRKKDTLPLPPGPPRLPLIGSAHHIPEDEKWEVFAGWKKQYGAYFRNFFSRAVI